MPVSRSHHSRRKLTPVVRATGTSQSIGSIPLLERALDAPCVHVPLGQSSDNGSLTLPLSSLAH